VSWQITWQEKEVDARPADVTTLRNYIAVSKEWSLSSRVRQDSRLIVAKFMGRKAWWLIDVVSTRFKLDVSSDLTGVARLWEPQVSPRRFTGWSFHRRGCYWAGTRFTVAQRHRRRGPVVSIYDLPLVVSFYWSNDIASEHSAVGLWLCWPDVLELTGRWTANLL